MVILIFLDLVISSSVFLSVHVHLRCQPFSFWRQWLGRLIISSKGFTFVMIVEMELNVPLRVRWENERSVIGAAILVVEKKNEPRVSKSEQRWAQ
jgi:hypothetical protein